ncbi:Formamidopyrimidine-DNA glycosylase [Halomicronema hongdechloris C2206]|uniref:Formamidopyrimidine-DNA glycosylase n=1 Tax=Halomicronema hongdechloris C2206 TaxID=1641165 RepID=A0A1Z3HI32_9CYAN|nr:DNA-formamidopyrimidine glycosylase [Halomicronema hongdechloris]ASC69955.1 Formamidopyrimidine-DNA glycosylase [Halomicronema hongdechloris C2206]
MPELPEVETVRLGLNRVTLNYPIRGGEVLLKRTIAHPLSVDAFLMGLQGCCLYHWRRRGKYLLAQLVQARGNPGGWLGIHLRMTGQMLWLLQSASPPRHCRVRLYFESGQELQFVDQRTFGRMWWVPPEYEPQQVIAGLATLGPEPLASTFSVPYLSQALRHRQRPIKNALLDQTLVAGIGNIYADEALFISGIHPQVPCAQLRRHRIERLHQSIRQVLTVGIEAGGTTFSDFHDIHGVNGNYSGVAWVYDREGNPCRVCETPIRRLRLAGRSAHYCPRCQR